MAKYGCDIGLGAQIGKDLVLPHHSGVVIHGNVKNGENVIIRRPLAKRNLTAERIISLLVIMSM